MSWEALMVPLPERLLHKCSRCLSRSVEAWRIIRGRERKEINPDLLATNVETCRRLHRAFMIIAFGIIQSMSLIASAGLISSEFALITRLRRPGAGNTFLWMEPNKFLLWRQCNFPDTTLKRQMTPDRKRSVYVKWTRTEEAAEVYPTPDFIDNLPKDLNLRERTCCIAMPSSYFNRATLAATLCGGLYFSILIFKRSRPLRRVLSHLNMKNGHHALNELKYCDIV